MLFPIRIFHWVVMVSVTLGVFGCSGGGGGSSSNSTTPPSTSPSTGSTALSSVTTTSNTLTLTSSEPLVVNAPFFGIEVRKNGADITDDIQNVETLSPTSFRYTFGSAALNQPGDSISISLQNRALATPGHYVAVRNTVQNMYQLLTNCQTGTGTCIGTPVPGLLASVKGMSRRYEPRNIETAPGVYDFSSIFDDAAYLAARGMKLHVMFTLKSFGTELLYSGNGSNRFFDISSEWDIVLGLDREVHVYLKDFSTNPHSFVETTGFTLDRSSSPAKVVMTVAPPSPQAPLPGDPVERNVLVVYGRDPFPAYTWNLSPPIAGWYASLPGVVGPGSGKEETGTHGFVHMPWNSTCVDWVRNFTAAFQTQWTTAIANGTIQSDAIESISIQETANVLVNSSNAGAYRAGLLEYAKFNAKAVRRRALHGLLMNQIPGGGTNPLTGAAVTTNQQSLTAHANSIIPWGSRLEGPDLHNNEDTLETKVYQLVHRDLRNKALTMIWHQNASYKALKNPLNPSAGYYNPAEQFVKAQRGVLDTSTASGTPGIEAEYVFWNMTTKKLPNTTDPSEDPWYYFRDALPVIAANPVIQTSGNDRYLWRRVANGTPIGDQTISRVNP